MSAKFRYGDNYNIPKKEIVDVEEYTHGRTKITYTAHKNHNLLDYCKSEGNKYWDPKSKCYKKYKTKRKKPLAI